jgi:hypothetical protein
MKKLWTLICMITCLLGLAACAKTDLTEHDQNKLNVAQQSVAPQMFSLMQFYMDEDSITALRQYSAVEVEYLINSEHGMNVDGTAFVQGLESFKATSEKVGGIVAMGESTAKIIGNRIVVDMEIKGADENATVRLYFSDDMFMKLESADLTAAYVFGVIVVILLIFWVAYRLGARSGRGGALSPGGEEESSVLRGVDQAVSNIMKQEEYAGTDDLELVAVIASAIAAYEGRISTGGYAVRSIRKINRSR